MSGIVGIVNTHGTPVDRTSLARMTRALAFRGPDGLRSWVSGSSTTTPLHPAEDTFPALGASPQVPQPRMPTADHPGPAAPRGGDENPGPGKVQLGFGHALLRSTYEAKQEQGPCSLDGRVWITADARIDGRDELIAVLRDHGCDVARDRPDPELILHAYAIWGEDCARHLLGDFAFGLWDARRRRLLCARDQCGVVPFFYSWRNGCLIFSNTLNVIRLHPDVSSRLNDRAIGDFLLFWENRELDTTTFADIRRLPPAHLLSWCDGTLRLQRYWSLPSAGDYIHGLRAEEYAEEFRALFRRAVADRLRTDRVAVALSGGMDSSAVAAAARDLLPTGSSTGTLHAYNFTCAPLIEPEETRCAGLVAAALDIPIQYLAATRMLRAPVEHGRLLPEPGEGWRPNVWDEMFSRMATADRTRVLLTGVGGDPALRPSRSYWFELLRTLQPGRLFGELLRYVRIHRHPPPLYLRLLLRRWLGRDPLGRGYPVWLDPGFAARLHLRQRYIRCVDEGFGQEALTRSPFWSNLAAMHDPGNWNVPVSVRHPFYDVRLLSFLQRVPPAPWLEEKRLLRTAMQPQLPEPVLSRPKVMSHGNPMSVLAEEGRAPRWMAELAAAPELEGYVDREALGRQLTAFGQPDLLRPVALAFWLRHQPDQPPG